MATTKGSGPKPAFSAGIPTIDVGCSFTPPTTTAGPLTGSGYFYGCSGSILTANKYEIYPQDQFSGGPSGSLLWYDVRVMHSGSAVGYTPLVTAATPTKLAFQVESSGSLAATQPNKIAVLMKFVRPGAL